MKLIDGIKIKKQNICTIAYRRRKKIRNVVQCVRVAVWSFGTAATGVIYAWRSNGLTLINKFFL